MKELPVPHLEELPDLSGHDLLQSAVFQPVQEAIKGSIGWQRARDVKIVIVGDDKIALEDVPKVGNLAEAFTLHDDERAEHGFLWIAFAPG